MTADQIVVLVFGCLYFLFILYSRKKTTFNEYAVAGKSLGGILIFSSLAASMIGPTYTMGIAREGFSDGLSYYLAIGWVGVNHLIMAYFFTNRLYSKFPDALSAGDVIAGYKSHNSNLVKLAVGILTFMQMIFISVIMAKAGGVLLGNFFGWSESFAVALTMIIITAYSFFGGIKATIVTDAFQFAHFIILIPLLILLMFLSDQFVMDDYLQFSTSKIVMETSSFEWVSYIGLATTWLFLGMMHPTAVSRILASKNQKTAKRSMIQTAIFMFVWMFLMVFLGDIGNFLYPDIPVDDQILLTLGSNLYPGIVNGIFIVAMIGVIMSTQDSILNNASIAFSTDILSAIKNDLSDSDKLLYSKTAIVIIGVVSIVASPFVDSLIGAFLILTSFFIPTYLPVMAFSLYVKEPKWQSALVCMSVGVMSSLLWHFFGNGDVIPTIVFGLTLSTSSYLITHFFLKGRGD